MIKTSEISPLLIITYNTIIVTESGWIINVFFFFWSTHTHFHKEGEGSYATNQALPSIEPDTVNERRTDPPPSQCLNCINLSFENTEIFLWS